MEFYNPDPHNLKRHIAVSIPNGMEFYDAKPQDKNYPKSVSIPNGMEFYFGSSAKSSDQNCFNSQRDGILPSKKELKGSYLLFQFPTGWNSTMEITFLGLIQNRFNSQRDGILRYLYTSTFSCKVCFNSQRDGILPKFVED